MSHGVCGAARSEERVNHCPPPRSSSTNWEKMRVKIYNQSLKPVMEGPQSTQRPCPGLPLRARISELPVSLCFKGAAGILCAALPWHGSSSPALRFSPLPCARGESLLSSCLFFVFFFFSSVRRISLPAVVPLLGPITVLLLYGLGQSSCPTDLFLLVVAALQHLELSSLLQPQALSTPTPLEKKRDVTTQPSGKFPWK